MREAAQKLIAAAVQIDAIKEGVRTAYIESMNAKDSLRTGALSGALAELEKIKPAELIANPEARNRRVSEWSTRLQSNG